MVCHSRIKQTQMTDLDQLEKAMIDAGYKITAKSDLEIRGTTQAGGYKILDFKRSKVGDGFTSTWAAEGVVEKIGKTYSALTVQKFAKTRGFSVINQKADQYVLVRR